MKDKKTVAVIGGGAAGLMACGVLAERVEKVLLIEKNKILGKKVRITGKGRCNITNTADIEDILNNVPTNSKFLYSALYSFTNYDVIDFFNRMGVETKEERGGRVFPVSDSAKDAAEIAEFVEKDGVHLQFYTGRTYYANRDDETLERYESSCRISRCSVWD